MFKPYPKSDQLGYNVGSPEAQALLKRSGRNRHRAPKTNKYGNKPMEFQDRTYHSQDECFYAQELEMRKLAGDIKEWKSQKALKLIVGGITVSVYTIDFEVTHNDDRIELIEYKGAEQAAWKKNWNLTKALLPIGAIPGIPKDAWLTLAKKQGKRFVNQRQLLNYEPD